MPYDNLCKYLCEKYPDRFASWVLGQSIHDVEILEPDLSIEPLRADTVTFLRTPDRILHLEFQVEVPNQKTIPSQMLNDWVRLYWEYELPIGQVLIWLKQTTNPAVFEDRFALEFTEHKYQVIRLWEQSPEPLLHNPALLPLATLAATEDDSQLLVEVIQQVNKIEEPEDRREIYACTQILAGLRFNEELIGNLFQEGIMRESVIYQQIIKEGLAEGFTEGLAEGLEQGRQAEVLLIQRLLKRRIGTVNPDLLAKIQKLYFSQLEDLGEALLDFELEEDLVEWFQKKQI